MKTTTLALSVAVLFFVPVAARATTPAAAADGSAVEKARVHFRQGVQLYNEASFEAALAEFRKAYQISPTYRMLYNIAQTYFELHDYVNSLGTLKQYVQEGGSEITPARRAEIEDLRQKLEGRIAYLDIVVSEEGADVRVDDLSVGTSPLKSPVLVKAGPRKIAAVKPGYDAAVRLVTVVGGERARVTLDIPERVATPASGDGAATGPSPIVVKPAATVVQKPVPTPKPIRTGLVASLAVAGGCAVATGVFAYLAATAKKDFDDELDRIPNSPQRIDDARSKAKRYAYVTDAFGAATLLATGAVLYYVFSGDGEAAVTKQVERKASVALSPTVGGVLLHGTW